MTDTNIILFEESKIRKIWHNERWHFSVIDVVAVLIDQSDFKKAKSYWTTLKNHLRKEGSQLVTDCDQLKMQSSDGKFYTTDAAHTETMLPLIQSVPSKKADSLKLWLAKVGTERIAEIQNPAQGMDRARELYLRDYMSGAELILTALA